MQLSLISRSVVYTSPIPTGIVTIVIGSGLTSVLPIKETRSVNFSYVMDTSQNNLLRRDYDRYLVYHLSLVTAELYSNCKMDSKCHSPTARC